MEAYSQAIDADPKSDAAFLHRGYCAYQLGDNAAAIADFSQSLAVQPNNSRAYLARASAYAADGNSTNALADVTEAIARDPRNPEGFLLRGRLNQQKGEHQLAVQDYAMPPRWLRIPKRVIWDVPSSFKPTGSRNALSRIASRRYASIPTLPRGICAALKRI